MSRMSRSHASAMMILLDHGIQSEAGCLGRPSATLFSKKRQPLERIDIKLVAVVVDGIDDTCRQSRSLINIMVPSLI